MSEILSRKEFEERKVADVHSRGGEISCRVGDAAATIEALAEELAVDDKRLVTTQGTLDYDRLTLRKRELRDARRGKGWI